MTCQLKVRWDLINFFFFPSSGCINVIGNPFHLGCSILQDAPLNKWVHLLKTIALYPLQEQVGEHKNLQTALFRNGMTDQNVAVQLKLRITNSTPFIFSWDRVAERRIRISLRLCLFRILWCLIVAKVWLSKCWRNRRGSVTELSGWGWGCRSHLWTVIKETTNIH